MRCAELFRNLIQIASTLSYGICDPVSWYVQVARKPWPYSLTYFLDILWTFSSSAYLTTFKILFIGAQAYTLYLMLTDYKPTHDPNVDTFKVEYLLGGSAVLAILFPYKYTITEVRISTSTTCRILQHSLTILPQH